MRIDEAELAEFKGRAEDLRKIIRYHIYSPMFYRTNLLIHSKRVAWITNELNPVAERVFGADYDPRRALLLALVHDDAEIVMGDIQAGNKGNMTAAQMAEVEQMERRAIDRITQRFPQTLAGYSYKDLLLDDFRHESLESQVVQFADKFDAFGEALHEVFGGNRVFVVNIVNEYGKIPTPIPFYLSWFSRYERKFPRMKPLLESGAELIQPMPELDYVKIADSGRLHDKRSLQRPTVYWPYDSWKEINLRYANEDELSSLLRPTEG